MSNKTQNRIESIKSIVDQMVQKISDPKNRLTACLHLHGVSHIASMLASRRGLDTEMASIIGLLHDYYLYATGVEEFHDQNTAEIVRPILRDLKVFTKEEQDIILSSIFYHSNKETTHSEYDELLKDADILYCYLNNGDMRVGKNVAHRLSRVCEEILIPCTYLLSDDLIPKKVEQIDRRQLLADLAEKYADEGIIGVQVNSTFREICKYWPGRYTYREFESGWCAAFVYFICRLAGFFLPIRYPNGCCRFAGVTAWVEWSQLPENSFFYKSNNKNFIPKRGDLVVFDQLITDKPYDHIGVVLACDGDYLRVAEGNVDNRNISGIIQRDRRRRVFGYIRISNSYEYNFTGKYTPG